MEITACCFRRRDWFSLSALPIAGLSFIVVLALRAIATVAKLFGQLDCYHYFAYTAKKFYAVYVQHNLAYLSEAPLPLLTYAKNIARRDLIWNEEDKKAALEMRRLFLRQYPNYPFVEKLANATLRGAKSTGICFGATNEFIKACFEKNVTCEADLIEVAQRFEEGFDKEAAALQVVYQKLHPYYNIFMSGLQPHYNALSGLIGLKAAAMEYYDLAEEKSQGDFNALEQGLWFASFTTGRGGGHAVVYLKFSFGSYIFDCNKGLMTTGGKTCAAAFKILQNAYASTSYARLRRFEPITHS